MLKAVYWWQHISLLKAHMSKNIKIRRSRGEYWLWSSQGSYCRASFSQHPAHLSLAFWHNPTAHLGRSTEQQINKRQMTWITPKEDWGRDRGHDWGSARVAGLKSRQPSIKFILCEIRGLGMFTPLVCTGELLIHLFIFTSMHFMF